MKNFFSKIICYSKLKNFKILFLFLIAFFVPQNARARLEAGSEVLNPKIQLIKDIDIINIKKDIFSNNFISDNPGVIKKDKIKSNAKLDSKDLDKEFKNLKLQKLTNLDQNKLDNEQKIKLKSNTTEENSFVENLKKEINRTIYKTNLNKLNIRKEESEFKKNDLNEINSGEITVGEFLIPSRGYVNLKGPKVTLNINDSDVLQTLKFLAKTGNYGFLYVGNNSSENEAGDEEIFIPKVTANFVNQDYSQVFNSLLMASNLQAKFENGVIFVGKDVFNKSLVPKFSKTYRMNQASAASVGDYLSTLGAKISKVFVKSTAIAGDELDGSLRTVEDFAENYINSYGLNGGPLRGLIGTVDLRLQTITLVGDKNLIATAEKYIKSLDVKHRQVALSVKIIDVSLTKSDLTNNRFEFVSGATTVFNNGGLAILTGNNAPRQPGSNSSVTSPSLGDAIAGNNLFSNWLERKITNDNAKIIASPTLILGENQEPIVSGDATIDDKLETATIGRPFANEAFIKVGENVITSFEVNTSDSGVTTCTGISGIAGITFGAKLNKIDDNGYVTFSLSPAISSVTKTETVANCGTQSTLSVRRLDTGIIRVKDGNTLVLTGVLKDEDTINTSKTPLIGDVPILGRLFRKNTTSKRKSELIILVTPRVLKER